MRRPEDQAPDRMRIDRWLWHARVVKTRALGAKLAQSGHVRINGRRIDAAGRAVRRDDVLTIALQNAVRVLKVVGFGERRGPATEARRLYDELGAAAPQELTSNSE